MHCSQASKLAGSISLISGAIEAPLAILCYQGCTPQAICSTYLVCPCDAPLQFLNVNNVSALKAVVLAVIRHCQSKGDSDSK